MFSKLKRLIGGGSKPSDPSGQVRSIIVSQEAMDAVETDPQMLVQDIVDYVNTMTGQAQYRVDELPAEAVQAHWSDYYLAQVNNGGHSQFIRNSRLDKPMMEAIYIGLQAMGAEETHAVFANMVTWAADNPEEAAAQTGFTGGRAEYLDTLDSRFYGIENRTPLSGSSARWLAGLGHIRAVPRADLPRVFAEMAVMNPNLDARRMAARVGQVRHMLTDQLHVSFGYAANCASEPAAVYALGGGAYFDVAGEQKMAFAVNAVGGGFFGVLDESGAHLYQRIEHDNPEIDRSNPDDMLAAVSDGRLAAFKGPEVGAHVITLPPERIEEAANMARDLDAAVAVDLLLRRIEPDPGLTFVSIREVSDDAASGVQRMLLTVLTDQRICAVLLERDGAMLLERGGEPPLSRASRAEIAQHSAFVSS